MLQAAKSIIIIGYQLLVDHVNRFSKYKSPKANLVLNSLEVLFWSAVTFLIMQANMKSCIGIPCILGWVIMGIGIVQRYVTGTFAQPCSTLTNR